MVILHTQKNKSKRFTLLHKLQGNSESTMLTI